VSYIIIIIIVVVVVVVAKTVKIKEQKFTMHTYILLLHYFTSYFKITSKCNLQKQMFYSEYLPDHDDFFVILH
jgi:uncharacterized membrane protein YciS (DUF1049 family)